MLNIPTGFSKDIQGKNTNLFPIVIIGTFPNDFNNANEIMLSTTHFTLPSSVYNPRVFKPILLNVPSLKESIDIEKRNYKISSLSISISNAKYGEERFTEFVGTDSLINKEIRMFWVSPSVDAVRYVDRADLNYDDTANWAFEVYYGIIRKYEHDDETVKLSIEDYSQPKLHKPLPSKRLPADDTILADYRNSPYPMVYGSNFKSPCVIGATLFDEDNMMVSTNNVALYADADDSNTEIHGSDPLYIFKNNYVRITQNITSVFAYSEATQYNINSNASNIIELESSNSSSPIVHNKIVGYEKLYPSNNIIVWRARRPDADWQYYYSTNSEVTDLDEGSFGKRISGTYVRESTGNPNTWGGGTRLIQNNSDAVNGFDFLRSPDDIWWGEADNTEGNPGHDESKERGAPGFSLLFNPISSDNYDEHYALLNIPGFRWRWDNGDYEENYLHMYFYIWSGGEFANLEGEGGGYGTGVADDYRSFEIEIKEDNAWGVPGDVPQEITYPSLVHFWALPQLNSGQGAIHGELQDVDIDHYMLIDDWTKAKFLAEVQGRLQFPTASEVIAHILENELNVDSSTIQTNTDTSYDVQCAFTVHESIDSKKLLEGLASVSPYIPRFNNMGNFKFDVIPSYGYKVHEGELVVDHTIQKQDVINFTYKKTDSERIYSKIDFKYNYDYGREEYLSNEIIDTSFLPDYDTMFYGLDTSHADSTLVIEDERSKYIRTPTAALQYVTWMLKWNCNSHLKIKCKLPLQYLSVEVGDILEFSGILGDVKPFGIDYSPESSFLNEDNIGYRGSYINGQQILPSFICISTNKTLEYVDIEVVQLVNMQDTFIPSTNVLLGSTHPLSLNYNPLANTNAAPPIFFTDYIINGGYIEYYYLINPTDDPTYEYVPSNWVNIPIDSNISHNYIFNYDKKYLGVDGGFQEDENGNHILDVIKEYTEVQGNNTAEYPNPYVHIASNCIFENETNTSTVQFHKILFIKIYYNNGNEFIHLKTLGIVDVPDNNLNILDIPVVVSSALYNQIYNNDTIELRIEFHFNVSELEDNPTHFSNGNAMELSFNTYGWINSPTEQHDLAEHSIEFTGGDVGDGGSSSPIQKDIEYDTAMMRDKITNDGYYELHISPIICKDKTLGITEIYKEVGGINGNTGVAFNFESTDILYGDMNNDLSFNILDVVALTNCVLGQDCDPEFPQGDMNGDSSFNILDVVTLVNCVLGQTCTGEQIIYG